MKGLQASHWFPSLEALEKNGRSAADSQTNASELRLDALDVGCSAADSRTYVLALAAERFRIEHDLDYCLAAGVYPTWEAVSTSNSLPSSDFTFALARRGKQTKETTVSLGAHPDVLYHRLAKAGLNFLRLELLQHG